MKKIMIILLILNSVFMCQLIGKVSYNKEVLLITSYHPTFPTFSEQIGGIDSVFKKYGVKFQVVTMDTKNYTNPENVNNFKNSLACKLNEHNKFDAIMVADDNALTFALNNQNTLFESIPIVFLGVNNVSTAIRQNYNNQVTGVIEVVSIRETITIMKEMFPDMSKVVALVDSLPSGQADLKSFYKVAAEFENLEFAELSLKKMSWDEFASSLSMVKENSCALLLSVFQDKYKKSKSFDEGVELIIRNINVPVFHLWEHGIGSGLIGGKVISHYNQGKVAAELVIKILEGKRIEELPVIDQSPNIYLFDREVLDKYGLSKFKFDREVVLINEEETIIDNHPILIAVVMIAFILLVSILILAFFYILYKKRVNKELKIAEKKYRRFVEHSPGISYRYSQKSGSLFWSTSIEHMLGFTQEDLVTNPFLWTNSIHPDDKHMVNNAFDSLAENNMYDIKYRIIDKFGNWHWLNDISTNIIYQKNEIIVEGFANDITEIINTTERLRLNKKRLQSILASMSEWVWEIDKDSKLVYTTDNIKNILGYSSKEILGKSFFDFSQNTKIDNYNHALYENIKLQRSFKNIKGCNVHKNGEIIYFISNGLAKFNENGDYIGYIGINRNVTEIEKNKEKLEELNSRMKMATDAAKLGIWNFDLQKNVLVWDRLTYKIFGVDPNDFEGKYESWQKFIHPNDYDYVMEQIERAKQRIKATEFEYRIIRPNGAIGYILAHAVAEFDQYGNPIRMTGTNQDITQSKLNEINVRRSEEKFRQAFLTSPDAINLNRLDDGMYIEINNSFTEIMGYTKEDVMGKSSNELNIWHNKMDRKVLLDSLVSKGYIKNLQAEFVSKNGEIIIGLISARIISIDKEAVILSIIRDITEIESMKSEKERFQTAIEQSKDGIFITDETSKIEYVNKSYIELTGFSENEILGQTPSFFGKDDENKEIYDELWETVSAGRTWTGRLVNKKKDGTDFIEQGTISPVFNDKNVIKNFVAVNRDITEEISLHAQFQQSQKMESIGNLAGGVAHDFNNMLSIIIGYVELLSFKEGLSDDITDMLNEIDNAARKSANLTKQLLTFARKEAIKPEVIDLNSVISSMNNMLHRLIGENIHFSFEPGEKLNLIKMDPSQVDQILANLCVNAKDAIGGFGSIKLTTSNATSDQIKSYNNQEDIIDFWNC